MRWVAERMETGRRPRGKPRKRRMDYVKEDGRVVDLDVVEENARWMTITRRPLEGTNGMMMILKCIKNTTF